MKSNYICDEPCPKCGGQVQLYGSECYPEDGITFECEICNYEGNVSVNDRCDCLMEIAKQSHKIIYNKLS